MSQIANTTGTGRSSTSKMDRGESQLNASSSGSLYCNRCQEVFSEFDALREHTKCMHQMYICDQCQQLFTHISSFASSHAATRWTPSTGCVPSVNISSSARSICHTTSRVTLTCNCTSVASARRASRCAVDCRFHMERQHRSKPKHMCKPCFMEFTETAMFYRTPETPQRVRCDVQV